MSEESPDTINFYGDSLNFEYRMIVDVQSEKATVDSRFAGQADVMTLIVIVNSFLSMMRRLCGWSEWPQIRTSRLWATSTQGSATTTGLIVRSLSVGSLSGR